MSDTNLKLTVNMYYGDILNIERGIVCHQVNCMGKMGAGIALAIRKRWPVVYTDYMNTYYARQLALGTVVLSVIVHGELYVASLCGQYYYGRKGRYTDYEAVGKCLEKVDIISKDFNLPVFIPYKMGCSLAGGDWNLVYRIIDSKMTNASIIVKQGSIYP